MGKVAGTLCVSSSRHGRLKGAGAQASLLSKRAQTLLLFPSSAAPGAGLGGPDPRGQPHLAPMYLGGGEHRHSS